MLLSHLHFNNLRSSVHDQNTCAIPPVHFETFSKQIIFIYLNTLPSQVDSVYSLHVPHSNLPKEQEPETKCATRVIENSTDSTWSWSFESPVSHNCSPSPCHGCSEHPCWAVGPCQAAGTPVQEVSSLVPPSAETEPKYQAAFPSRPPRGREGCGARGLRLPGVASSGNPHVPQDIPKRWFTGWIHSHPTEQTVQRESINLCPVSLLNNELYP